MFTRGAKSSYIDFLYFQNDKTNIAEVSKSTECFQSMYENVTDPCGIGFLIGS